jgi:hypothetical protein
MILCYVFVHVKSIPVHGGKTITSLFILVMNARVYRITFLSIFLGGAEIRFLLSVLFEPMTITSVVCGIRTPMLLAQVAMLLKTDFLGNPGRRIGTMAFLPFLALVGGLLGRFQIAILVGADAFDCF